jgi:hypothetical protein
MLEPITYRASIDSIFASMKQGGIRNDGCYFVYTNYMQTVEASSIRLIVIEP